MQLVTTKRTNGDETPGAILRAGTTFGKSGKIKVSENSEIVFRSVRLYARNRALFSSERRLSFNMIFRRFTQRHIKRQKLRVLPVINVSSAVFPVKSRTSKISALWQTGVTI
ncbi:hypothetical protein [Dysosmobacter sp. HCP28S3_G4]|uniref:hypothetical protein n=1 Tax=Dysosmobacter sp. HCP28S3_G4 TaxID=3438938 RepID=UPI003F8C1776